MNKEKTDAEIFDFNIRYGPQKENKINTECVLTKTDNPLYQLYTGLYFQKCYHNIGRYKWIDGNQEYVYEGKLYANDLHGYGKLVYPDNTSYEGLFFHNKRFGPGIVTYPSENVQDVGYWDSKYLIRICQNIELDDFYLETVPILGKTLEGKLYLLKFKELIPLVDKNNPFANLVKKLNLKPDLCEKLFSKCIRNYKSLFFNHSIYDENFYTDSRDLIVEIFERFDENGEPVTNKLTATNLLAWNNGKKYMEIMKHTFMNRKYEKLLSYKIRNAVLPNRRDTFMPEGPIEEMSLQLLAACRSNNIEKINKLICEYDIYPNLMDCYGNTTIIYAAMSNKRDAIRTLATLGANLNSVNDECITALMLCILNYIAILNETLECNWEDAFLKLSERSKGSVNGRIWPTKSCSGSSDEHENEQTENTSFELESKLSGSSKSSSFYPTKKEKKSKKRKEKISPKAENKIINNTYIFNLIYKAPERETTAKKQTFFRRKLKLSRKFRKTIKCDKTAALEDVENTIRVLIECGADVNGCLVPYPPVISILFTENVDLLILMLQNKANVNQRTSRGSGLLNPLHVLCAMKRNANQAKILEILVDYGVDVNARSDMSHWPETRDKLLGGDPCEDEYSMNGKTPFHVLALRYDYEEDTDNNIIEMAKILVKSGADPNDKYLGHNVLTLALIRGNIKLAEFLLSNKLVDPNENIGNMGVPLTLLACRKYSKSATRTSKLDPIMDVLVKYNANPFNMLTDFYGNAIEFATANKDEQKNPSLVVNALLRVARICLRRYIDSQAYQIVFKHVRLTEFNPMIKYIVKYLTVQKSCKLMQILLDNKLIPPNFEACMSVLHYINSRVGKGNVNVQLVDRVRTNSNKNHTPPFFEKMKTLVQIKCKKEVFELDFCLKDEETLEKYNPSMPEIDKNHEKYRVCYSCLQRKGKNLQLCPYCSLVYFCSVKCNAKENRNGQHPCKKLFYSSRLGSAHIHKRKKSRDKSRQLTLDGLFLEEVTPEDSLSDEIDSNDSSITRERKLAKRLRRKQKEKAAKKRRAKLRRNMRAKRLGGRYKYYSFYRGRGMKGLGGKYREFRGSYKGQFAKQFKWFADKAKYYQRLREKLRSGTCDGKLISIGFKEDLKAVMKQVRRKYGNPEIKPLMREVWSNTLNCKFPLNAENIDMMLRTAKRVNLQLIPINNEVINPCDPFDYKFWQLFLPYCVFQDGELFYRSNDKDLFYKLPYKC